MSKCKYEPNTFELTELEIQVLLKLREWAKRFEVPYMYVKWKDCHASHWFDGNTPVTIDMLVEQLGIEKKQFSIIAKYLDDAGLLKANWYSQSEDELFSVKTNFATEHFCRKLERNLKSKRVLKYQEDLDTQSFAKLWKTCKSFVLEVVAWTFGSADEPEVAYGLKEL